MMIQLALTLAAGLAGYLLARGFVRRRLRFVDAVQSPVAPLVAGVLAALATWPLALLPMVTFGTTLMFGLGTALGTASGARWLRRDERQLRQLTP
jgi:hypothetical protein